MKTVTIKLEDIPPDETARQFLRSLEQSQEEVVLEQNGQPRGVWVPARLLELRRQAKEDFFRAVERIRTQNPELDSEELLNELEELDDSERPLP